MKPGLSSQIAFAMALVGITCTTLGHYTEAWIVGYAVAVIFALIGAAVFIGSEKP